MSGATRRQQRRRQRRPAYSEKQSPYSYSNYDDYGAYGDPPYRAPPYPPYPTYQPAPLSSDAMILRMGDIIQSSIERAMTPIVQRLEAVEGKVDHLGEDRASKTEITNLLADVTAMRRETYPKEIIDQMRAQTNDRIASATEAGRTLDREVNERLGGLKTDMDARFAGLNTSSLNNTTKFWLAFEGAIGGLGLLFAFIQHISIH